MSGKRSRFGHDVNESEVDESNKVAGKRRQIRIERPSATDIETLSQGFPRAVAITESQENTGEQHRVDIGPKVSKRTLSTVKQSNRNQPEQSSKPNKKPKSDTADTYRIPETCLEESCHLKSPTKETQSVPEKELVLSDEEFCLQQTSSKVYEDLKTSNVRTETQTPVLASVSTSPRQSEEQLIELLLKFQPLFHKDVDGDTLLHLAIIHRKCTLVYAAIIAMVKRKAEARHCSGLDIQNNLRQAPIHLAVLTCQPLVVKYLAQHGADVDGIDRNGQTALHLACKNADVEDVRALTQGVDIWQRQHENYRKTIDVNVRNFEGMAPIHLATLTGSCEVLHELLEMKASIDLQDSKSGRTALHHAVEAHNPVAVRFLLTHLANVNAQTFAGNTPLHTASGRHMDAIISVLLEFGADPRLENSEGDLPLPETHRLYLLEKKSSASSQRKTKR